MKFSVQLKDPDGFYDGVHDAVKAQIDELGKLSDDERESLEEIRMNSINEAIDKWVEYNEYITIEFDTEANTATVVPRN